MTSELINKIDLQSEGASGVNDSSQEIQPGQGEMDADTSASLSSPLPPVSVQVHPFYSVYKPLNIGMPVTVEITCAPKLGKQATHLILVLDTSGSMNDPVGTLRGRMVTAIRIVRDAIDRMISTAHAELKGVEVSCTVITFNSTANIIFDENHLPEFLELESLLNHLNRGENGTDMGKAIQLMDATRKPGVNTHCLFLTDGKDQNSLIDIYRHGVDGRSSIKELEGLLAKMSTDPLLTLHVVGICADVLNPSVDADFLKWISSKALQSTDIMMDVPSIRKASILLIGLVKSMVPKRLALEVEIVPAGPYRKRVNGTIEIHPLVLRTDMPSYVSVMVNGPCTVSTRLITAQREIDAEYTAHASAEVPKTHPGELKVNPVALAEHVSELHGVFQGLKGKMVREKKWEELHRELDAIEAVIKHFESDAPSPRLAQLMRFITAERIFIDEAKTKTGNEFELECFKADSQSNDAGRSVSLNIHSARTLSADQIRTLDEDAEQLEEGEVVPSSLPEEDQHPRRGRVCAFDYTLRQAD